MVVPRCDRVHAPNVMPAGTRSVHGGLVDSDGVAGYRWPPERRPPTPVARPAGIVTLLFTDIEGSTRLLQQLGARYPDLLSRHHELMREAIEAHGGVEVGTEGDSFFVVFRSPDRALRAVAAAQRALASEDWPDGAAVAVRMGLHTGPVELRDGLYVGLEVHRAARVAAAAHGGQVVLSRGTRELLSERLPAGGSLRDLGEHRLKDLDEPEQLFQLVLDGLQGDFPPLRSLSARFHVLPSERSTFVGRGSELEHIGRLLEDTRLLTLTGAGGTGKSRLALQVARRYDARYRDGVAHVALAPIGDPRLVAPTIRGTLGFREDPERDAVETLVEQLHSREMLLLLDNFEQVLPAAADVARLLSGTERLSILVTSRAALHLEGEQEFGVPPLRLPVVGEASDRDAIAESEAVALFVERARRAQPRFVLDERNARTVALICARLDGLPLAIELAAARIKLLPPEALLARLSRRLEVLQSAGPDRDDRQRTLRGAIDWSHELLDPQLRVVFRRLAVFVGGSSLEAVEALVARVPGRAPEPAGQGAAVEGARPAPPAEPPAIDALEAVGALIDHSLVRQEEHDREPRLLMLETIREFASERLAASGEADAMAEAHARWFLALVGRHAPNFTRGPAALDRVETDHDNVRAALRWAITRPDCDLALRSVWALWRFWHLRGHLAEGLALCEETLAMPGAAAPVEARAQVLCARGSLHYWRGDMGAARVDYLQALEVARASGSRRTEAEALFSLGYVYPATGDFEQAQASLGQALGIFEELGDGLGAMNARGTAAFVRALAGDFVGAASAYDAVLPELESAGDQFWLLSQLVPVAWTMQRLGRLADARELHLRILDGALELGDGTLQHMAAQGLASIAAQLGDAARALRMAGGLEAMAEELGGRAPRELVLALDPVTLVREQGSTEAEVALALAQGRRLDRPTLLDLARGVRIGDDASPADSGADP
jgi:predicted ATPase/class 3 adenylate cyclase